MNSFNGPRARDRRQPIAEGVCKYGRFFCSRLATVPALARLLTAHWADTRRSAALIGSGACPSAPAPSGCRRGGGRSMRRVTLFVNGSARNGKVRPGRAGPGPLPRGPARPPAAPGAPGRARAEPAGAGRGVPLSARGGNRDTGGGARCPEGVASGRSCEAPLWDEGSAGTRTLRAGTLGIIALNC